MTMKMICLVKVGGVDTLKVVTTASSMNQGQLVKTLPGVGKSFIMFATFSGTPIAADFDGLPVVSADIEVNNVTIADMLADPDGMLARLTFAP